MKISLCLTSCKPIGLNNCYTFSTIGRSVRRFPGKEYKVLESQVNQELRKFRPQINKFNNAFDENKHYLTAEYRFYMPIMTKDKRIHKRAGDLSNLVKPIEDIVFKQFVADDSHIASMNVHKIQSKEPRIEIEYAIKDLHHIN
jgi:Holliday junction resolvase RusA-like endonuclease